jgi:hypothetical protein
VLDLCGHVAQRQPRAAREADDLRARDRLRNVMSSAVITWSGTSPTIGNAVVEG